MKKIFLLGTLFLLLLSSTAFATNWQWVDSDDECGWFIDTDNMRYELTQSIYPTVDTSRITFWEKIFYTQAGANEFAKRVNDWRCRDLAYSLDLQTISLRDKTCIIFATYYYRKDGSLIKAEEEGYDILQIVPETFGEAVFFAVRDYARTHHAQLVRNAYSN